MTLTTQHLTLADYLNYEDGTDTRYELVRGELIPMALGKGRRGEISDFINTCFRDQIKRLDREWVSKPMMIGIQSPRGDRWGTVRIPDVVVLPLSQWRELQDREAIVYLQEPAPLLVVEVVSESTQSIDYRAKRSEYSVLEIPEYWVIDPLTQKITLFVLEEGWYDGTEFTGNKIVQSNLFPELKLTVEQILAGDIEESMR